MKISNLKILQVWLTLIFWFSIVFLSQVFNIFINDLLDLFVELSSPSFWICFFQTFWGVSTILAISISLYISYKQLLGKRWGMPPIGIPRRRLKELIFLSVVVRFVLSPFFSHAGDTTTFLLAGYNIAHGKDQYDLRLSTYGGPRIPRMIPGQDWFLLDYPPLWGILTSISYRLSNLIAPDSLILYIFSLKFWLILSDILLAYLLFHIVRSKTTLDNASKAALFYLLCPFVILIGSIWGQIDGLCALFTTLSIYLLVERHPFASGLALGIGSGFKYYPMVIAPIIFLSSREKKSKLTFVIGLVLTSLLVLVSPFLLWGGTSFTRFLRHMSWLFQTTGPYLTPFYILEMTLFITKKDSWIQAWFWIKENPLVGNLWMLPMIWVYLRHRKLVDTRSNDSNPDLEEVLTSSICALLVFTTFRFWVTEQMFLTSLTLSILYSYAFETNDSDYLNLTWILLVLSSWFTTRLGHHLLLPVWDLVAGWAFYITHLGNRYMFWMRTLTTSIIGLFLATFNITFFYLLQKRMRDSTNLG